MKKEIRVADPNDPRNKEATSSEELVWEIEEEDEEYSKVFIGRIPIMLKSFYCHLNAQGEKDLFGMGECPYDQVGLDFLSGDWKIENAWFLARPNENTRSVFRLPSETRRVFISSAQNKAQRAFKNKFCFF
jgi:DNA-directed RNA polymerase II subunit RPB2